MAKTVTDTQGASGPDTPTSTVPPNLAALANSWQAMLLKDLGITVTATSVAALTYWANSEGTVWANNPLAISGHATGSQSCIAQCGSGSEIMSYDTMANGVQATADFLTKNNYAGVVGALTTAVDNKDGSPNISDMARIWSNINKSGWCRGCQGGMYPEALHAALGQNASQIISDLNKGAGFGDYFNAISNSVKTGVGDVGSSVAAPITKWTDIIPLVGKIATEITTLAFWKRVGMGLLGAILLLIGIWMVVGQTKIGSSAESGVKTVATVAAVA